MKARGSGSKATLDAAEWWFCPLHTSPRGSKVPLARRVAGSDILFGHSDGVAKDSGYSRVARTQSLYCLSRMAMMMIMV
jgi:hypothetical protein